jgi:hypothetical protein
MKRIIISAALIVLSSALGILEPIKEKPILLSDAKQWEHTGAYYQKVIMPDGLRLELKSRTPLSKEQWQKMADDIQKAIENEPKPEICPVCGQDYWP